MAPQPADTSLAATGNTHPRRQPPPRHSGRERDPPPQNEGPAGEAAGPKPGPGKGGSVCGVFEPGWAEEEAVGEVGQGRRGGGVGGKALRDRGTPQVTLAGLVGSIS